ncbi:MAG: DUF58 domain-containing protein [Planctomycetes bacterium]|nr:DUF58 domain-containing protein [Planctomycetota bacterium]
MASLLDPAFQARLAGLELALRRALPSSLRGDRRSPLRKGISLEFADYRPYAPGDDVRHLDWASYARLDQLILKLYHDEEDVQLHVVLDDSESMRFGEPEKAQYARQVAAALVWIGLGSGNRVALTRLADQPDTVELTRGMASYARFAQALEAPSLESCGALHTWCRTFANTRRPRGVIVLLSDLLDRAGPRACLEALQRPATELTVLHLLAREELEPRLEGDLRLVDGEDEQTVDVSVTERLLDTYRRTARAFVASCAETARARDVVYARTTTDTPLEAFVLGTLTGQGVLR